MHTCIYSYFFLKKKLGIKVRYCKSKSYCFIEVHTNFTPLTQISDFRSFSNVLKEFFALFLDKTSLQLRSNMRWKDVLDNASLMCLIN